MYWHEEDERKPTVSLDTVDVAFDLEGRTLPVDHAYALARAVGEVLPWLAAEPSAGIHPVYVAGSGNGWMRPEGSDELLHLSRRTKLLLRLPQRRVEDAKALCGQPIEVSGHRLGVGRASVRPLQAIGTLFARYIVVEANADENDFLAQTAAGLRALGVAPRKMLCGREARLATPTGPLRVNSLMLAELKPDESLKLLLHGLGPRRELGCGIFIGHKDIAPVKQNLD